MTIHEQIKASEYVLYSDEDILLVIDYDPISKGHILILPQKPYLDIDEIPFPTLTKLFKAAQTYIKLLKLKFAPKGFSMMQNGGHYNEIDVFHLHVFPRFNETEFDYQNKNAIPETELAVIRSLFAQELKKE